MLKVLVVEDEQDLCEMIAETLTDEGYDVTCAKDGAEAMAAASATAFDLVLADMRLPKVDGLTLFRRLREERPDTDVIVMTGNAAVADAVAVLKEGAFDYLTKPINLDELGVQLQRLATFRSLRRDVAEARTELREPASSREQLVGHSPGMLRLVKRIETIAQSDAAVVITGESGTGKELVARALHEGSGRRAKPFIAVNCAAFPDTLIEAELFGYERGAFTDANTRRDGRFKAAHGGTLFLDEVAELSQTAQAKLLRVLQEGTIEPLGSNETVKVDVRIVSATHRDLRARIADGLFREDLYYRINTLDIADSAAALPGRGSPGARAALHPALLQPGAPDRRHHLAGLERAVDVSVPGQRPGADAHDPARRAAGERRQDRRRAPSRVDPGRCARRLATAGRADGAARHGPQAVRARLSDPRARRVRREEGEGGRRARDLPQESLGEAEDARHRRGPGGRAGGTFRKRRQRRQPVRGLSVGPRRLGLHPLRGQGRT